MGKRITRADELPSWFDTGKYEGAIHLDARGWLEQLDVRSVCHSIVWYSEIPDDLQESVVYGFPPRDFLSAVRNKPIFPFNGSHFAKSINRNLGFDDLPIVEVPKTPPGINPITPYDIGSIMLEMEPERQKEFLRWLEVKCVRFSSLKNREKPPPDYPDWFFEPFVSRRFAPVNIGIGLPTKLLRQSFDLFVSSQRENREPFLAQKAQRANTFLEWCNCGLLQYLDLSIWSIEKDRSITNKALAHGIFPNNYEKG